MSLRAGRNPASVNPLDEAAAKRDAAASFEGEMVGSIARGWMHDLSRTNHVLIGRPIPTELANRADVPAPAFTDTHTIWFQEDTVMQEIKLGRDNPDAWHELAMRMKGLNYHELGHIRFSPRNDSALTKRIIAKRDGNKDTGDSPDPTWWWWYNAIEDQRIETLTVTEWAPTGPYFRHMIDRFIMDGPAPQESWPLLYGRKHVRPAVREGSRQAFEALLLAKTVPSTDPIKLAQGVEEPKYTPAKVADLMDEAAALINEYLVLPIGPGEASAKVENAAFDIISRLHSMFKDDVEQSKDGGGPGEPAPGTGTLDRLNDLGDYAGAEERAASEAAADAAAKQIEKSNKADAKAKEAGEDGEGEGGGDQDDAEGSFTLEGEESGTGVSTKKTSNDNVQNSARALAQAVEDSMKATKSDRKLQTEVRNTIRSVRTFATELSFDLRSQDKAQAKEVPVQAVDASVSAQIVNAIEELKANLEPEWEQKVTYGRINPLRHITSRLGALDIFDHYYEGDEEAGETEVVIVLDKSSSMNGEKMIRASRALWTLKHAFDQLDMKCTVLLYNTYSEVGYRADEVTLPHKYKLFSSSGGTSPTTSIKTARRVFGQSKAKHKFLVNITDGQWGRWGEAETEIEAMKMMGVVTSIFGLDQAVSRYGLHGCQVGTDIEEPSVIVNIVRALVQRALAEARHR